jgi:hypothetical protein
MKLRVMKVISISITAVVLSIFSSSASAYVVWSAIYLGTPFARGYSLTQVNASEDFVVYIDTSVFLESYWHGSNSGFASAVNTGLGTIAPAETLLWRSSEDWWWVIGYHFFLEDDANTFDDATFSTIFW